MIWARHAFGKALGLVDCWREDSIMSTNWRRAEQFAITDHDVRAFETLLTKRNGAGAATDAVAHEAGVLATVPMINSGDGADLLIDVAARGGRSLPLQLDTGAADTVFTTDYARAVGISVRRIKTNQYRRPSVTGDPLLFWVTAQGGGAESRHFNYALLGGEYLRRYVVDLDFVRRRVRFLDPSIHDLRDDTGRLPGEQLVPLEIRGTLPFVELMLGNGTVRALVDTGWQGAVSITEEKARELGIEINPDAERVKFVNVLGSATALVHELRGARVGDVVLPDTTLLISIRSASDVRIERWVEDETILGLLVLNRYRVRLDYPHGVMGLTPIPPEAGPSRATVPQ